MNVMIRS